ncbi:MAG: GntR family transcriptional regulator [Gemmatimonadales bacterium]
MPNREWRIREVLWHRIASGIHRGTLTPGQRLPSTRQLGAEFGAAPRTVMAAYAELAREGVVELRRRSGIYVAKRPASERTVPGSSAWLVELLLKSLQEGLPPSALPGRLAEVFGSRRLLAACIAGNRDQADHLCRELRDDYGVAAAPLDSERLTADQSTAVLRRANLVVSTALAVIPARAAAGRFRKPLIVVRLRPEVIAEMVARLRAGPVYFVGTDPRFAEALRVIFDPTGVSHHLRPVILGRDNPDSIPPTAPVYILELAYERLGDTHLTRRVKPLPRVFSEETAREILSTIIPADR